MRRALDKPVLELSAKNHLPSFPEFTKLFFCPSLRKLSGEFIDPESDENLFKTPQEPELWKDLCQFCSEEGGPMPSLSPLYI